MSKKKTNKKSKKVILIISIALVVIASGFAAGSYLLSAVNPTGEKVIVNISEGSTLDDIASALEENGLVRNKTVFKIYIRIQNKQDDLKAGRYSFSTDMGCKEIAQKLVDGETGDTVMLTIREGLNVEQIAQYLEESGFFTAEEFLDEIKNNLDYYKGLYGFLEDVPADREYGLEGYLFGSTYEVYVDSTPRDIIIKMLDGFDTIFEEEYYARCAELGMSVDEIVTMASIVEREGIVDGELARIAGVFYNRLEDGMMLQSCATLQYIFKDYQFTFTQEQMNVDSPYNTYVNTGLPAGPISNFRQTALVAALYPESHNYYYFCSKNDGTGESAFASTLSEHEANVERYSQSWE